MIFARTCSNFLEGFFHKAPQEGIFNEGNVRVTRLKIKTALYLMFRPDFMFFLSVLSF